MVKQSNQIQTQKRRYHEDNLIGHRIVAAAIAISNNRSVARDQTLHRRHLAGAQLKVDKLLERIFREEFRQVFGPSGRAHLGPGHTRPARIQASSVLPLIVS